MAEETTTETVEEELTTTTTEAPPAKGEEQLPDAVKEILAKERKAARDAEKARKAAEAKAKEYEDRDKTEQQKLEERATTAEADAKSAAAKLLRFEVAAEKEIPLKHAHRLQGSTKEELEKDADELAKELNAGGRPDFGGGTRSQTTQRSGDMDSLIRSSAGR